MPDRTASDHATNPIEQAMSASRGGNGRSGVEARTGPARGAAEKANEYRQWDERGREWLYGFVWFEQRRDGGIARGYMQVSRPVLGKSIRVERLIEQKSLVILSHLPFPAFFGAVLDRLAPVFFQHGYSALEAACHGIASW